MTILLSQAASIFYQFKVHVVLRYLMQKRNASLAVQPSIFDSPQGNDHSTDYMYMVYIEDETQSR